MSQMSVRSALQKALPYTHFSSFAPQYEKDFEQLWMKHRSSPVMISVDSAYNFARDMVARGHNDWTLSNEDTAQLEKFRAIDGIPLDVFAIFSEDSNFDAGKHLKKRGQIQLTIGNTCEPVDNKTYQWTVFVESPCGDVQPVKSVKFELHPTFNPSSITTTKQPFSITRRGWGTFDINIDVTFSNGTVHSYIHNLNFGKKRSDKKYTVFLGDENTKKIATVTPAHTEWLKQGGGIEQATAPSHRMKNIPSVVNWKDDNKRGDGLMHSLREYGFAYIGGHSVPELLLRQMMELNQQFFSESEGSIELPRQPEMPVQQCKTQRGYGEIESEALNPFLDFDLKQTFDYSEENPSYSTEQTGLNHWPVNLPISKRGFREACLKYLNHTTQLAKTILSEVDKGMSTNKQLLTPFKDAVVINRLIRYLPQHSAKEMQMGAGSHVDYGAVTLIYEDVSGLEVFHDGKWVEVPHVEGTFVVLTGFVLEKLTNGAIKAVKHRVRNESSKMRHSMATFYDPNPSAVIAPLKTLGAPRYDMCKAGQKGILLALKKPQVLAY